MLKKNDPATSLLLCRDASSEKVARGKVSRLWAEGVGSYAALLAGHPAGDVAAALRHHKICGCPSTELSAECL